MKIRMSRKEFSKYYKDYINGVSIDNIEFKTFNYDELLVFFKKNYYDLDFNKYVCWQPDGLIDNVPFGLYYLDFIASSNDFSYMLGLVDNSKGTKTIVFCLVYDLDYGLVDEEENKVGYISTIETNYFFRNKGVLNIALEEIKMLFKNNEILVVSPESIKGSQVGIFKRICDKFEGKVKVIDEDDYVDSLKQRHKW